MADAPLRGGRAPPRNAEEEKEGQWRSGKSEGGRRRRDVVASSERRCRHEEGKKEESMRSSRGFAKAEGRKPGVLEEGEEAGKTEGVLVVSGKREELS
eukprot:1491769-Rhodomonas_salina.1